MSAAKFGFDTTREMWRWLDANNGKFAGPFSMVDNWTYGRCEVTAVVNGTWKEWRMLNEQEHGMVA